MNQRSSEAGRETAPSSPDRSGAAPRLVLASEALRDDLAPVEPARRLGRLVLVGIAGALVLLGLSLRLGFGPRCDWDSASIAFAAGGIAAAAAALPFLYALRAIVAIALGLVLMVLGTQGVGPLAGLAADEGLFRNVIRLTTMSLLPAALLFRATYRAYRPARIALAGAFALSVPFVAQQLLVALDPAAQPAVRAGAVFDVLVVLCGLFGFMGKDTTGGSSVWASLLLAVLAADVALRELTPRIDAGAGRLVYGTAAVGVLCAAIMVSFGLYQLLAAVLAGDARRVSMKKSPPGPETSPA